MDGLQANSLHFTCKSYLISRHSVEYGPFKGVMNLLWPVSHSTINLWSKMEKVILPTVYHSMMSLCPPIAIE